MKLPVLYMNALCFIVLVRYFENVRKRPTSGHDLFSTKTVRLTRLKKHASLKALTSWSNHRRGVDAYCSFHISLSDAFWRLLYYSLLFLAESFMIFVNVFCVLRNEISVGSDKKEGIFPIYPNCKNRSLW